VFSFVRIVMQTGGVDPREFKNEGRWARKDRAGQLGL